MAVVAGALALGGAALYLAWPRPERNVIPPGEASPGLYVAGQPAGAEWPEIVGRLGIRSVINLRGPRPGERWYVDELAACRRLGVAHDDVRVKLDDWPPQHEVRRYVELLDRMPRPLLLHCKNGIDRSGWGAAVALALSGAPLARALDYLSPTHGHICNPATCPLHRFFARYQKWLAATGTAHSGDSFRRWALEVYCPPPYDAEIAVLTWPLPRRVVAGAPLVLMVHVVNRSDQPWTMTAAPDHGIRLGARILGPFATPPADALAIFRTATNPARDLARAGIEDATVPPGGERVLPLGFDAPETAGAYVVHIDMVDERVHWFSDLGGAGVIVPLEVVRR